MVVERAQNAKRMQGDLGNMAGAPDSSIDRGSAKFSS